MFEGVTLFLSTLCSTGCRIYKVGKEFGPEQTLVVSIVKEDTTPSSQSIPIEVEPNESIEDSREKG